MGTGQTLLLGTIAGSTIVLGMPLGRMQRVAPGLRVALNGIAIGVLLFLVWDVFSGAWEPIDAALAGVHEHTGGIGPVLGYGALFFGGTTVGLMGLVYYERFLNRGVAPSSSRLALLIAVGIGLHNFAEGLAIGSAAATGEIALATLLVIGFALHNATEGFGIVAPLAGDEERPSWSKLLGLAAIGGGPTFVGTLVGHSFTSDALSVVFLTLAAGSILYVVLALLQVAFKAGLRELLCWGLLSGLAAGFITDMVVTAGGV